MTVSGKRGAELDTKKREKFMANLEDTIRRSLRRGDSASRCSASQYVIMLPRANYENSCMVCERIVKSFCRQYPHSPARVRFSVHPLEPSLPGTQPQTV
jgi:GGDEF domain-containing protein